MTGIFRSSPASNSIRTKSSEFDSLRCPCLSCEDNQFSDFSVVLFRPHCMRISEKNRVKAHTTQWFRAMLYPPERLSGTTRRGHTMAPEAQKPSQWRCPYETPKRDVLTTYCAQSTFTGYHPQVRMHTRCNHDTEKSAKFYRT
jgi:hypothetical protein